MSNDHKTSSMVTEKGCSTDSCPPPKTCTISESKLHAEAGVENVHVKVEDPQFASKNQVFSHVHSRRFEGTAAAPLCPRGSWRVVCLLFFVLCLVAVILFIIDIIHHT